MKAWTWTSCSCSSDRSGGWHAPWRGNAPVESAPQHGRGAGSAFSCFLVSRDLSDLRKDLRPTSRTHSSRTPFPDATFFSQGDTNVSCPPRHSPKCQLSSDLEHVADAGR